MKGLAGVFAFSPLREKVLEGRMRGFAEAAVQPPHPVFRWTRKTTLSRKGERVNTDNSADQSAFTLCPMAQVTPKGSLSWP